MIRFAVWAAVSSVEQVQGASLPNQVERCRERGLAEGWQDTGLTYVADGYSRTGYINLTDAEADIQPLAECMKAMRGSQYDVLCLYNFDRLGDLIVMVANDFRNHKKQLYSVSQPSKVFENYDPYGDDSSYILQVLAPIWQKQRISDLRRKWRTGMPRRLEDGLNPLSIPFGYRWRSRREPPEPIPAQIDLIREMGRMVMAGQSYGAIARMAEASGILPPRGKRNRWEISTIQYILANRFYAGQLTLYKERSVFAPDKAGRTERLARPRSDWMVRPGKHLAVWTSDEHREILRELDRRNEVNFRGARGPLSGMLFCQECGRKIYRVSQIRRRNPHEYFPVLTCNRTGAVGSRAHVRWKYDEAMPAIARAVQRSLSREPRNPPKSRPVDLSAALDDLAARRERIQNSAELGVFSPREAAEKIANLERQADSLRARVEAEEQRALSRARFSEQMADQIPYLADWVLGDDPALVNRMLSSIIRRIVVTPDREVLVELR